MSTFLIKLTPLDSFFFGGEVTFGQSNEDYFVRSIMFPQQTTLFGMLRFHLLKQNGFLDKDGKNIGNKEEADSLIGSSSFNPTKSSQSFGRINGISPVFIIGPGGPLFFQSREFGYVDVEDEISRMKKRILKPLKVLKKNGYCSYCDGQKTDALRYFNTGFQKNEYPELLVNSITGKMSEINEIFIEDEQVGIKIPNKSEGNKKLYFRQVKYRFKPNVCFAFFVELNDNNTTNVTFDSSHIKMGADRSFFKLDISKKDGRINDFFSRGSNSLVNNLFTEVNEINGKIVLLSDSYIYRYIYNSIPFVSAETTSFRCIQSVYREGTYSLKKAGIDMKKSSTYMLLKKGSVFYIDPDKKDQILSEINGMKNFRTIGYNYAI